MLDFSNDQGLLATLTSFVTLGIAVGTVTFQYGARRRLEDEFERHKIAHDRQYEADKLEQRGKFETYKAEHDKKYAEDRERDLRDFMAYQKLQDELRHSMNDRFEGRTRVLEVAAAERAKDCRDFDVRLARIEK
jgi:hypothetical protein